MNTRSRLAAARLALATSVSLVICNSALAQTPPPVRPTVDDNGVDLFTGRPVIDGPALTIGSADHGISYYKMYRGSEWTDNLVAAIAITGSQVTVTFGGVSDRFIQNGSVYTPTEGHGAQLTLSGSIYTYTSIEGTVATFEKSVSGYYPRFGTAARVTSITSSNGEKLTFSYESTQYCSSTKPGSSGTLCVGHKTAYRLGTVDNRYGYRAIFSYSDTGEDPSDPDSLFDPVTWATPSGVTLLNRATNGSVTGTGFTNAAGQPANYVLSADGVTSITRPGRNTPDVTIAYSAGRVSTLTTATGTVAYSPPSDTGGERAVTVTDQASQTTSYVFDIASQRMKRVTDATNRTTSYEYDSSGRLTRTVQPEGNYTEMVYDGRGNVTMKTSVAKPGSGQANIVTSAVYPTSCTVTCSQPISTTDARGNVTDYTYDPVHGNVLTITAPATPNGERPQVRYSYAATTNSVTGESVYLLTGSSTCRTSASCQGTADETKTTIAYESGNLLPTSVTVAAGDNSLSATTQTSYDAIGNVASTADAGGNVTNIFYNANRQPTGIAGPDPDGAGILERPAIDIAYTPDGQILNRTEGRVSPTWAFTVHRQEQSAYDAAGRKERVAIVSGSGTYSVTDYGYDAAGRLECTTVRMNPAVWGSRSAACTPMAIAEHGPDRITRTLYDAAGRVTSVTSGFGTSAASADVSYTYSPNGQVLTETDGENNRTTNIYDGFDRLSQRQYPAAVQGANVSNGNDHEEFGYDPAGNLTITRRRDNRLLYAAYDALNRLTTKSMDQGCATYQIGACPPASATRSVHYDYDLAGHLTSARFDSPTGEGVAATYDALGRQVSETSTMGGNTRTVASAYDAAGNRSRVTHPDGVYFDQFFDGLGRFRQANWWAPTSGGVQFAAITYDQQGRRSDFNRASSFTGYVYDPASRLTGMNQRFVGGAGNLTLTMGRNPAGQISDTTKDNDDYAFKSHYSVDRPYTANGLNQYTAAGSVAFAYDRNGNLQTSGTTTYAYDPENRLISSSTGASLRYDPLGRLWQTSGGADGSTQFLYDGDHVVAEYDGANGSLRRRYMWGPGADEPILIDQGGMNCSTTRFAHTDERGSIIALADCFGNRANVQTYDEYGIPDQANAPVTAGGRFGYTGQIWIPELGLWYYKARMYSPTLGRFLQTDPIGYGDGMNSYNYVGGDPVNRFDPSGLKATTGSQNVPCGFPGEAPCTGPEIEVRASGGGGWGALGWVTICNGNCGGIYQPISAVRPIAEQPAGAVIQLPQNNAPKDDPKCALALAQAGNIAFEATVGSLIVGGGITGSRGTFINLRTGTTGSFFSLGGGGGADIGIAEVAGTASSLGLLNKGGASASVSAGIATFSANGSLGKGGITPAGKSAGLGFGTLKVGASLTLTGTRLYGCKVRGQ